MAYGNRYRKAKKATKKPARKYRRKQSGVKKLANDLRILKRQVAGEKKTLESGLVPGTGIGQCFVNGDAQWTLDMTPRPPQGDGFDERVGRSIKLVSMSLQYQISQQSNTNHPMRIQFYIVRLMGVPQNAGVAYANFKKQNPITGVRDSMALRDLNHFKDYRVIKTFSCYLPQDQASGNLVVKTGRINLKLNHYVNFEGNTTSLTDGQIMMFAFADSGNIGGTNSSLPNVVIQAPNTGAIIQTYTKFWYTDN